MQMLLDWHAFEYHASVPWPQLERPQTDWELGIRSIEYWLNDHVGNRLKHWAWDDSRSNYHIGVAFRWDQHRTLFVLAWGQ
jgi:hypothetical protein